MRDRMFYGQFAGRMFLAGVALTLHLARAQTISQQPQSRTNLVGTTATFSVLATGTGPLTYQWRFGSSDLTDGGGITGTTTPTLTIANSQPVHSGNYSVVVTSGAGSVTSQIATLLVFQPPAGGTVDTSFAPSGSLSGINIPVCVLALQPDGKVLVGGEFMYVQGSTRQYLMRLDAAGAIDTGFTPTTGPVQRMALQPDGKVLIAGGFSSVNGVDINHLARLNPDGTLDTAFTNGLAYGGGVPGGPIGGIALQPDGKIIIGGTFNSVHGATRNNIARLHSDATLDTTFQAGMTGTSGSVGPVVLQPDGRVLIGGEFTRVNGVTRNGIARLDADGGLDESFMSGVVGTEAGAAVYCLALQPDGKVLIGGTFLRINGISQDYIARLNPDGTTDMFFETEANSSVHSLAVQPDGRILLGGQFTAVNDVPRSHLARLEPDGQLDTTFEVALSGGPYPSVVTIVTENEWKCLVGGAFTTANGQAVNSMARLWGGPPREAPWILRLPPGQDLRSGTNVQFIVTALGDPPLAYQWRKNGTNLVDDSRLLGTTQSSLMIENLEPSDAGEYTVVITNVWGAITGTPPALLTVDQAPRIVASPQSQSALPGAAAAFSVVAAGCGPLTFQWYRDGVPLADGGRFSGTRTATLAISSAAASDAGSYQVSVSNAEGTTSSQSATLYVPPCRLVGHLESSKGWARRVAAAGNLVYVANTKDPQRSTLGSLDIVDVSDPTNPVRRGTFDALGDVNSVAVSGNRAYLARGYTEPFGLTVMDVSNPAAPVVLGRYGSFSLTGQGNDVAVSGTWAYLAAGVGLHVIDVGNPAAPVRVGQWTGSYSTEDVVLSGEYAYLGASGLHVISVADPTNCVRVGGTPAAPLSGVALSGNLAYCHGALGIRVYDVSNPSTVVQRSRVDVGNVLDLALAGNRGYAAAGDDGLRIVDLSDPLHPAPMGTCATPGFAQGVAVAGGLIYVADGPAGLSVFSPGMDLGPEVLEQPQDALTTSGGTACFSVAANGTPPLRYQWLFGNVLLDGATNAMLWLTNVQPGQAGGYSVVVTNAVGSTTSSEAQLTVVVPPVLEIEWSQEFPRLSLNGVIGYVYAVESTPELLWPSDWLVLTNAVLAANPWRFTDTTTPGAQGYYRARQLDYAPESIAGRTLVATVTNAGPFVVTVVYEATTFTETAIGTFSGTYSYTKTGPTTARIEDLVTDPPEAVGDTSTILLRFTSYAGGTFVSSFTDEGGTLETMLGTFQILSPGG